MSDGTRKPARKSAKKKKQEREEKFFALVDRAQELVEEAVNSGELELKDLKQITGTLKDLKDLIFDKDSKGSEKKDEGMIIKIEGDVE